MCSSFINSLVHARHLVPLLALLAAIGSGACATEGVEPEQGPFISPLLANDLRTSARIGPEGGSVNAIGADGTEYTLTIPVDALTEEAEISLTPIVSIDDLPMSGGLRGGVHFEPSGLQLMRAATLAVILPSAPRLDGAELLAGFTYDGDGDNLTLALAEARGDSFTLPIHHFSGGGAGAATRSDLEAVFAPGTADTFIADLMAASQALDSDAVQSAFRRWYETLVKPDLQAAVSNDAALERALAGYARWLGVEGFISGLADVSGLVSESHDLAGAAIRDAVARANDACERQQSFAEVEKALTWQRCAEGLLPVGVLASHELDRDAVVAALCLQVVFESTSFPGAPVVGEPGTLSAVVGYAFGNGATQFAEGMDAGVSATGATPANEVIVTNASGDLELALTPTQGSVSIEVNACIGNAPGSGPLTGALVCQRAFVVRGLVIEPGDAEIAPGGSVSFEAFLGGEPAEVNWQATGGTIDGSGLYRADAGEGGFSVRATSVDDPSLTASVTVTVRTAATDLDFREFQGKWLGDLVTSTGVRLCDNVDNAQCAVFDFGQISTPEFVNLRACAGLPAGETQCTIAALWTGGSIAGNVFTADEHSIVTTTTQRPSAEACPVRLTLETDPDGTQHLRGQLQGTGAPCGGEGFATVDLTRAP
jgi:hypothetical protein